MSPSLTPLPTNPRCSEPTSGLDARAASIVVRAMRNIATTGRTVVCTIHQPSLAVFSVSFTRVLLPCCQRNVCPGWDYLFCNGHMRGPSGHSSLCDVLP